MKVFIKDADDLTTCVRAVMDYFNYKDWKGKNVFVKPNMLRVARPEECIITEPQLIRKVTELLIAADAMVTVGDNPIPQPFDETEVARRCGFFAASKGTFKNIGRSVKKVRLNNKKVKEVYVSKEILQCDILISLPKFKTHELTALSIAIKNQFGIIPGGLKPGLHYECFKLEDFCNLLIDIYQIRPPDLIIVDCLNIRDARGRLFKPRRIIAGDNGFAVDYVCSLLAGMDPLTNPLVGIALRKRLFNPEEIEVIGKIEVIKDFTPPFFFPLRGFITGLANWFFSRLSSLKIPLINPELCSNCRLCENVCPSRIIKAGKIDYSKCIKCYCCIEVCPNKAITVKFRLP